MGYLFTRYSLFYEDRVNRNQFSTAERYLLIRQQLKETVRHETHHMTTHVITDLTATSARGVAFAVC